MSTTGARSDRNSAAGGKWPRTVLRVGFGVVWLVDAVMKWLPGFRAAYMDAVMGEGEGQPGWLEPWFRFWSAVQHPRVTAFEYLVAVIETLIAVAVLLGFARKVTYIAAIVFSLLIWGVAEGFGGPYTAGAADVGTALIYAIVFAALLLFSYYDGPAPWSVDVMLERKLGWWHRVAEVGHPASAQGHSETERLHTAEARGTASV